MAELDLRKQTILRAVIVEYVTGAEPIGSELLTAKYPLGVKSATVRNELAEMAELGYLEQPHTSAGRIPSDMGYRYFVDRMVVRREPEASVKGQVRDVTDEGDALLALLSETTRLLSRLTHLLTAATTVQDHTLTVRNAVLSALGPKQALLVLVLSNGQIENRMIEIPSGLTLHEIGQANEIMTQSFGGKTVRSLVRAKLPSSNGNPNLDKLVSAISSNIRSLAKGLSRGKLIMEGEEFLLAQPEFQRESHNLQELVALLQDPDAIYDAVAEHTDSHESVTIGKEHRAETLRPLSVVRHSFYVGESEAGSIAVIGPTRMQYDRSIPIVGFAARAISEALTRYLAQ